jgi:GNAT superfamily N-acetyltransferase
MQYSLRPHGSTAGGTSTLVGISIAAWKAMVFEVSPHLFFEVHFLFYVRDTDRLRAIEKEMLALSSEYNHSEHRQTFLYVPVVIESQKALAEKLLEHIYLRPSVHLIVISDQLVEVARATELARVIHGCSTMNWLVIQQIALLNGQPSFESLFAAEVMDSPEMLRVLRSAIELSSTRIGLLSSYGSEEPTNFENDSQAVSVGLVETTEDLSECLKLRRRIYGILGYLPSHVTQASEPWEMDFFDNNALHFLARDLKTGKLAGTIRLVVPQRLKVLLSGSIHGDSLRDQREIVRLLAQNIRTPDYKKALRLGHVVPLPCLENAIPTNNWSDVLQLALDGAETSRLIVDPVYRGSGLSRMLIHVALSAALDLGRRAVLGQCLPLHVPMYEKYGFQEIEGRLASSEDSMPYPFTPQALLFSLEGGRALERLRWTAELFKMATKDLENSQLIRMRA